MILPRTIFGMGTGRCGTFSLTKLLEKQHNTYAIHEESDLPWEKDLLEMWRLFYRFQSKVFSEKSDTEVFATVGFFWINYVSELMSTMLGPKFICLKRDKQETCESWIHHTVCGVGDLNHWTDPESKHWGKEKYMSNEWSHMWPKYDAPKLEAISRYYDEYYDMAEFWQTKFPDTFAIFPIETMNTKHGVKSILEFAGYKDPVVHVNVKLNTRRSPRGEIQES
jgi:hypothetical protein